MPKSSPTLTAATLFPIWPLSFNFFSTPIVPLA
jgi:hypothetical protein